MEWKLSSGLGVGTAVVVALTAGLVLGAGTTTVGVQPESTTIGTGETTTVDIVVESVDDGIGSVDLGLAVADDRVAGIRDVSVAGNPATTRTTGDNDSMRIAATGMDTADTGPVTVATVTLEGESAGTSTLDLTVAAVGNESGSAYDVTGTTDGELTVEGDSDSTDDDGPAAAAYGPRETTAGTSVTFNASNSTSETADGIERYEWTFDDGTSATGRVVTHTYDDPGTYRVVLRVTDSNGFDEDGTGIVVDAAPDGSQDDSDDANSDTDETTDTGDASDDETTDGTNTTDAGTDDDTGNESTSDGDTDEAGTPTPQPTTPTTATETPTSRATATGGSTQSPPMSATTTDTTVTEPGSLQLVPLAVIGGLATLGAGLLYYWRD